MITIKFIIWTVLAIGLIMIIINTMSKTTNMTKEHKELLENMKKHDKKYK